MQVSIPTSMGQISDGAMTPIQKAGIVLVPRDAMLEGNNWANRAIALAKTQRRDWPRLVLELFRMSIEARVQVLKVLKADHKEEGRILRDDADGMTGLNKADAGRANRSQATYLSQCSTIVNALQAGMTVQSLAVFHGMSAEDAEDEDAAFDTLMDVASMAKIYAHALQFSKGKAGRTPDPWMVKVGKWLDKNAPADEADEVESEQYQAFVKLWNELSKG